MIGILGSKKGAWKCIFSSSVICHSIFRMEQPRGQFVYVNGAPQQPAVQNVVVQGQQQRQQFVVLAPAPQQFVVCILFNYIPFPVSAFRLIGTLIIRITLIR